MPEQVRTFLSVYLAKKSVGNAQSQEVYFSLEKLLLKFYEVKSESLAWV